MPALNGANGTFPAERSPRERFLIINAGRTGSSLLCAVLAAAGADFGMAADQTWSADDGAFEQEAVTRAAAWLGTACRLGPTPPLWPQRWRWDFARHRAKSHLRHALAAARFVKGPNLDLAVQPAAKFGYEPRIIVSYRAFSAQAMSLAQRSAHSEATALEAYYLRTYKNALMWLLVYGGCVVDYDELVDPKETAWTAALSAVTGLAAPALAAARQARVDPRVRRRPARLPALSAECERLYECLRGFSGQAVLPSHLAARSSARRLAGAAAAPDGARSAATA
jgi:hypothetical protein